MALRWSAGLLVAATWLSGMVFGLYILAFFGGAAAHGSLDRWNQSLTGLHTAGFTTATVGIGSHFLTGGVLLLLGPIQLVGKVRRRLPAVHRWLGRIYVLFAGLAGAGGLAFILTRGTIGGTVMDIGFGLYGTLVVIAAVQTYAKARAGRFGQHRAWGIRLFALAVGSWLYRIEYGFWFMAIGRLGHTTDFRGWFDAVMMFAFYLPNLAVAELFIRARKRPVAAHRATRTAASAVLLAASAFVIVATWFFTAQFWGPGIVSGLTGAPL